MTNLTLMQIETELPELLELRDSILSGESADSAALCPDEQALAAIDAQIAEYVKRETVKVDNIAGLLREFQYRADIAGEESARLLARSKLWQIRRERLADLVVTVMQNAGKTKLEGATSTLALHKNPPSVEIRQPDFVPAEYRQVTLTLGLIELEGIAALLEADDCESAAEVLRSAAKRSEPRKKAIADAMKQQGIPVPGCALVTDNVHVRVK